MRSEREASLLRRHHDFLFLWCGEVTGKYGAAVASVAMPLIAVTVLGASTFEVGLLGAATWLPWLIVGLPVGVWVDRWPRRNIMLSAAAASIVTSASIPVLAGTGTLTVELLMALALTLGTASVFFQTAYSAYVPSILEPKDQAEGNAKLHGSASVAQIAGLGSAGVIAQVAGAIASMFVNAAMFMVSLLCIARIRHREPQGTRAALRSDSLWDDIVEGLRFVSTDPWLRPLTAFAAASNLALMAYQTVQVVFLVRTVGLSPGLVGAAIAAASAGGAFGAFAASRVARRMGTSRATVVLETLLPVAGLLMPLTFGGLGISLFIVGGFCISAGVVAGNVLKAGFQQRYCPPELFGRLVASTTFVSYATIPVGAVVGGALGAWIGDRAALGVAVAGIPLAGLILVFSPFRHARDLPTSQAVPDAHVR